MQYKLRELESFKAWRESIRDRRARVAIARRVERVQNGNFGDHESVGGGVSELRVHVGAGYRVYFTIREKELVILLAGGDKKSQKADIKYAKKLAAEI
ncbi:MAG TPA: type II toxin-antitoxin system RelE/ParE family toxin [Rudaea sp.]|jgi:putative addiction module killer protein|nr:type II toxin-antitoxin system RelE/ParE family toxin [Rudaea sp.]